MPPVCRRAIPRTPRKGARGFEGTANPEKPDAKKGEETLDSESRERLEECMRALVAAEEDISPSDFELRVVSDEAQFATFASHASTHDTSIRPAETRFLLAVPHARLFREWLKTRPGAWSGEHVPMVFSGYCGRAWIYLRSHTGTLAQTISENYRNAAREAGVAVAVVSNGSAGENSFAPDPEYDPVDPGYDKTGTRPATFEDFGIDEFEADALFLSPSVYAKAVEIAVDDAEVREAVAAWFSSTRRSAIAKAATVTAEDLDDCVRNHAELRFAESAASASERLVGSPGAEAEEPDYAPLPETVVDWRRERARRVERDGEVSAAVRDKVGGEM